jgi:hypothetical protein
MVELLSCFISVSLWAAFGLDGVRVVNIPDQTVTLNIKPLQINVIVVTICNNWSAEKMESGEGIRAVAHRGGPLRVVPGSLPLVVESTLQERRRLSLGANPDSLAVAGKRLTRDRLRAAAFRLGKNCGR